MDIANDANAGQGAPLAAKLAAVGVLLALIGLEVVLLRRRGQRYPWRDALISMGVSLGLPVARLLDAAVIGGLYVLAYQHRVFNLPADSAVTWAAAFVWLEFALYWLHRWSHEVRWLWASHVVHHTPTEVILPTAFRLPWTGLLQGNWLPGLIGMAIGFPPTVILGVLGLELGYVFLQHTRFIGKLGPLEWLLNSPTHHRLHHSSEPQHHDCNYGSVLIVFDRLFGSFKRDEREPERYGVYGADAAGSRGVFDAALGEWRRLFLDIWNAPDGLTALRVAISRPGSTVAAQRREAPPSAAELFDVQPLAERLVDAGRAANEMPRGAAHRVA